MNEVYHVTKTSRDWLFLAGGGNRVKQSEDGHY
jgi:hypothetical protein